jgi:beta-ureidopropionase
MPSVVRAALTQTINAYSDMPPLDRLGELSGKLEDIRHANVSHNLDLARRAASQGAGVVCFGELFPGPYFAGTQHRVWHGMAENARRGPTSLAVQAAAKELGIVIVAPIYELDPNGKRFNTALVVDATGELLGCYRKVHVPHGRNEEGVFAEGFYYERSDGKAWQGSKNVAFNPYFPVFETAVGRIGVAICYDRHFEGVVPALALGGAKLIFCPAVTFGIKSRRMWDLEFPVDASRHRVFIGGSNRLGTEGPWGQDYFGSSYFTGPGGRLENLSDDDALVISDVEFEELERPDPSGWRLVRDARPEAFQSPSS